MSCLIDSGDVLQATEDVQQGLTQDDFDMFYEVWEQYDESATQYVPLEKLYEFVDALEEPLRIPAPNFYRLVVLDVPICANDTVHCIDVLDLLTRNFLVTRGEGGGDLGELKKGPERKDYHPVSSLMKRQREMYAASVIQRAWHAYLERKNGVTPDLEKESGGGEGEETSDGDKTGGDSWGGHGGGVEANNKVMEQLTSMV